jgi:hypothetical protein
VSKIRKACVSQERPEHRLRFYIEAGEEQNKFSTYVCHEDVEPSIEFLDLGYNGFIHGLGISNVDLVGLAWRETSDQFERK